MRGLSLCVAALVLSLGSLTGCAASNSARVTLLRYEDFGPQSGVYEWLGYEWWQWLPEGGGDPAQHFDVGIVVYRGVAEEVVRRQYPVDPKRLQDYRYVAYDDAIRHLDLLIAEDDVPSVTEQLRATRRELRRRFESQ